jgi:hypothetical protein
LTRAASFLLATLLASAGQWQDSRPESRPDPSALLSEIDSRIYSAEREGMTGVEFTYQPPVTGPMEIPSFRVQVRWRKGARETIEFQKPDGTPLADLPEVLRGTAGSAAPREQFEQGARGILGMFRGLSYSEQYKNWRKRLEVRIVNGREERTIVCEPHVGGFFQRVEISLDRKTLPWRIVSVPARPEPGMDRLVDEPAFGEFDGKLLMTGSKYTRGAASKQVVVNYQRKDGLIVPASYETLVPGKPAEKVVFENVVVSR